MTNTVLISALNFPFHESVTHFHRKLAPNDETGSKNIVLLAQLQITSLPEDTVHIIIINDLKQGHRQTLFVLFVLFCLKAL